MMSAKIRIIFELLVKKEKYCSMFNVNKHYRLPQKENIEYAYSSQTQQLEGSFNKTQISSLTKA